MRGDLLLYSKKKMSLLVDREYFIYKMRESLLLAGNHSDALLDRVIQLSNVPAVPKVYESPLKFISNTNLEVGGGGAKYKISHLRDVVESPSNITPTGVQAIYTDFAADSSMDIRRLKPTAAVTVAGGGAGSASSIRSTNNNNLQTTSTGNLNNGGNGSQHVSNPEIIGGSGGASLVKENQQQRKQHQQQQQQFNVNHLGQAPPPRTNTGSRRGSAINNNNTSNTAIQEEDEDGEGGGGGVHPASHIALMAPERVPPAVLDGNRLRPKPPRRPSSSMIGADTAASAVANGAGNRKLETIQGTMIESNLGTTGTR